MALSKEDIKFFEDEEKEAENSFDFSVWRQLNVDQLS